MRRSSVRHSTEEPGRRVAQLRLRRRCATDSFLRLLSSTVAPRPSYTLRTAWHRELVVRGSHTPLTPHDETLRCDRGVHGDESVNEDGRRMPTKAGFWSICDAHASAVSRGPADQQSGYWHLWPIAAWGLLRWLGAIG